MNDTAVMALVIAAALYGSGSFLAVHGSGFGLYVLGGLLAALGLLLTALVWRAT